VLTDFQGAADLIWYAVRIIILIAIIILFMMVTLRRFLDKKIISPLETIDLANRKLDRDSTEVNAILLPGDTPDEIRKIADSRAKMLDDIIAVSKERLRFSDIYAKVVATEPYMNGTLNELRITYINPQDREILSDWIDAA